MTYILGLLKYLRSAKYDTGVGAKNTRRGSDEGCSAWSSGDTTISPGSAVRTPPNTLSRGASRLRGLSLSFNVAEDAKDTHESTRSGEGGRGRVSFAAEGDGHGDGDGDADGDGERLRKPSLYWKACSLALDVLCSECREGDIQMMGGSIC